MELDVGLLETDTIRVASPLQSALPPPPFSTASYETEEDDDEEEEEEKDAKKKKKASQPKKKKHKQSPPRRIPASLVQLTFMALLPACPMCAGKRKCALAVFPNRQRSKDELGHVGRAMLFGHWCLKCKAYHQVECHGHKNLYLPYRVDPATKRFRSAESVAKYVCLHANDVVAEWFSQCGGW
jgi:hypothetical protein